MNYKLALEQILGRNWSAGEPLKGRICSDEELRLGDDDALVKPLRTKRIATTFGRAAFILI